MVFDAHHLVNLRYDQLDYIVQLFCTINMFARRTSRFIGDWYMDMNVFCLIEFIFFFLFSLYNLRISIYTYAAHRLTYPSARHKKRIDSGKLCEVVFIVCTVYLTAEFQSSVMPNYIHNLPVPTCWYYPY